MGQQLCFTRRGTGFQKHLLDVSPKETSSAALPNYEQNKPFICQLKILKDQGGMLILQKNWSRQNPALAFCLSPWLLHGWQTEKTENQTTMIQPKRSIHSSANDHCLLALKV